MCEVLDLRTVNKRVLEALVKSGACDTLDALDHDLPAAALRARLLAAVDSACEHGARTQRDRDLGQADLFGGAGTASGPRQLPDVPAWGETEQLQYEKEALGLYWSGHPVDRFGEDLQAFGAVPLAELTARRTGEDDAAGAGAAAGTPSVDVSVGGIVAQLRPLKTRKGDPMCVCTLEDAQGSIEVVVFPEAFRQHGHLVESGRMLLVTGRLERDDDSARLLASEIQPLEQVRERLVRAVAIRVSMPPHDRGTFERLWDVFAHHKGDRRVAFDIDLQEADRHLRVTVDVNAQIRVRPSEHLVSEVERICGEGSVRLR
jgi:DNA polymerase-3 subunit alpha